MWFFPEISFDLVGIVFLVFCSMVFLQLIYLLIFPLRLAIHKKKATNTKLPSVSVIVCARNEEDNLFKNLPTILNQNYPIFEVIVVNDQSVDDSKHIIRAYQEKYKFLRYIELEKNKHRKFGKKIPLTVGIKGAKYDFIALIDADCKTGSKNWLKNLMSNYQEGKEIVIGYGPYEKEKGFLNRLIRFDTSMIASTYLSFAKFGKPYMAVGRNFSYRKETFFEVNGFKSHYHIQSGDDDLFMQEAANKKNVAIELNSESFVYSEPKKTWKSWVRQKQRHFTTASKYRLINKFLLGIFPLSMVLMLLSFFILLFSFKWRLFVLAVYLFRTVIYWVINSMVLKKLDERDLIPWFPVLELIHFVVIPFIYYSTDRTEQNKW